MVTILLFIQIVDAFHISAVLMPRDSCDSCPVLEFTKLTQMKITLRVSALLSAPFLTGNCLTEN